MTLARHEEDRNLTEDLSGIAECSETQLTELDTIVQAVHDSADWENPDARSCSTPISSASLMSLQCNTIQ